MAIETLLYGITMTTDDGEGDDVFVNLYRSRERAVSQMREHHRELWNTELPAEPNPKGFYCDEEFGIAYEITEFTLED